ncbi:hypothetical protein SUDANB174_01171 [Streptomyces sp. enrichment culture]
MNEPAVLLVDEPTSALDHERGAVVIDLIARLTRRQASATVLVTHDRTHLSAADRIAEVHAGDPGRPPPSVGRGLPHDSFRYIVETSRQIND